MVELKGSLNGIGLPAIVQLIGELHHSGSLQLAKDNANALLGFEDGRLVLAACAHERGMGALALCARDLSDAEFTFIEGRIEGDRTLDLGYVDVQRQLSLFANGAAAPEGALSAVSPALSEEAPSACPLLGFADDRDRRYSRPTALHRCFASGAASLVTAQEQRELCLGDRFGTCPRYRNSSLGLGAPALVPLPEPAQPESRPEMPQAVAARIASVSAPRTPPREVPETPAPVQPPRRPRSVQLVVAGTLLGVVALLAALVVVIPTFNSGLLPRPATPQPAPAFQPVPTAAAKPAATLAQQPTQVRQAAPQPTLLPPTTIPTVPLPTATTPAKPTVATSAARSLLDLRLADGPAPNWRENPPYAGWSDGAYRLQARQAARFVALGVPLDVPLADLTVSATFRKTGGPPGGGYGLIVRDQGPDPRDGVNQNMNAYILETGDLGEFGVWRRDGDHWFDLVPWTRSGAVRPGGSPNELSVRATSDRLIFSANGVELATIQDDTFPAGGVGMFVGGDYNEVAVDRFAIQVPN